MTLASSISAGKSNAKNGFGAYVGYRQFCLLNVKDDKGEVGALLDDAKDNSGSPKQLCDAMAGADDILFAQE